jgi:hypothetical protein
MHASRILLALLFGALSVSASESRSSGISISGAPFVICLQPQPFSYSATDVYPFVLPEIQDFDPYHASDDALRDYNSGIIVFYQTDGFDVLPPGVSIYDSPVRREFSVRGVPRLGWGGWSAQQREYVRRYNYSLIQCIRFAHHRS